MNRRRISTIIVSVLAVVTFGFAAVNASTSGGDGGPRSKLTLIAPAAPGGGWDAFAREGQQAMRLGGIVGNVQVVNVPGASGTIGLGQLVSMQGREDILMATGGVMVGGIITNRSAVTLDDVVPIASVAEDYDVLVVPADSPYETLDDFVEAMRTEPGSLAIAGGSLGGIDHLIAGMIAREAGVDPQQVNYVVYSGGAEVITSLLSHTAKAGLSGYNEFRDQIEAGNLRALALSAADPVDTIPVKTFIEQGVNVEMANWRGWVAPPGISDELRAEFTDIITEMRDTPEWADTLKRNNWVDAFRTGDDFVDYIREESERTAEVLKELGL